MQLPSALWRLIALVVALALTLVAFIVVLPLMAIAGIVILLIAGSVATYAWLIRSRQPNGLLDGRRNVRVRSDEEQT